ncbi:MAG: ABC transporter substrate-binding protein [Vicinamibacteria bacterium]
MRAVTGPVAVVLLSTGLASCRRPEIAPAARDIVLGQATSAATFDPHGRDLSQTSITLSHFFEPLVAFSAEMEVKPSLAERWENPSDTLWRLHLRRNVLFHDGRSFGAEDVAASLRRALGPGSQVRHYVQAIASVRVVDDSTVEIVTQFPAPVLLNNLVFVPIVPRDTGPEEVRDPVGTGPYRFVSGTPDGVIVGERFDRYWGPKPAFERVTIVPLPEPGDRAEAVTSGKVDIVSQYPSQSWAESRGRPDVRLVSRRGLSNVILSFSLRREMPFADVRLRRAVALGIDREALVRDALGGRGTRLDQVVPPSVVGYARSLPPTALDRDRARRLVVEAGFPSGIEVPLVTSDANADVAQALGAQLVGIGIRLKLRTLPQKDFYEAWVAGETPTSLFGWAAATGDASETFGALLHSPREGYGRFNRFAYGTRRLDELIETSDRELRPRERQDLLARAAEVVQDEIPLVPLVLRDDLYAVRAGLEFHPRLDRRVRAFELRPIP